MQRTADDGSRRSQTVVGVVGVGGIASVLVTAILEGPHRDDYSFVLSPRSESRSQELARRFAAVSVGRDNQEVAQRADLVVLAVLPDQVEEVCSTMSFRRDQVVASLAAGWPPSRLSRLVEPARSVCQLIPLPMIAMHTGPLVMFPAEPLVQRLLDGCGTLVVPAQETDLATLNSLSAVMSTYFEVQLSLARWGEDQGLDRAVAIQYVSNLFAGLGLEAQAVDRSSWSALPLHHETPGGWNAQVREGMTSRGLLDALALELDRLLATRVGTPGQQPA